MVFTYSEYIKTYIVGMFNAFMLFVALSLPFPIEAAAKLSIPISILYIPFC